MLQLLLLQIYSGSVLSPLCKSPLLHYYAYWTCCQVCCKIGASNVLISFSFNFDQANYFQQDWLYCCSIVFLDLCYYTFTLHHLLPCLITLLLLLFVYCFIFTIHEPRVFRKQTLYRHKVEVRFVYTLPSQTPWDFLGLLLLFDQVKLGVWGDKFNILKQPQSNSCREHMKSIKLFTLFKLYTKQQDSNVISF